MSAPRLRWDALYQVARCDFLLRDQGTILGFLWTLLRPALTFAVIDVTFSEWFKRYIPNFHAHLLIGIVTWEFFARATTNAVSIFERKRAIVRNFAFHRAMLPAASVLVVFATYLIECAIVVALLAGFGKVHWAGLPLFLLMTVSNLLLALSLGILIASLNVFYRDVEHAWGLLLRIGFFVTPIFYPLQVIAPMKQAVIRMNPLYHVITIGREALLGGGLPSADALLTLVGGVAAISLAAWLVFRRSQALMAEQL